MLRLALLAAAATLALPAEAQTNAMGQPDLTGLWTNATRTTLERDPKYGDRATMNAEEAAAVRDDPETPVMKIDGQYRTSMIVTPANGRLPEMTAQAEADRKSRLASYRRGAGYARGDNPESMTPAERCLKDFGSSSGPPMMPIGYNNTYQIVQTPDHVAILVEMIHDVRIIPLTKTHKPDAIRPWMGDSVGWYEGDTLVVETTNFRANQGFRGGPSDIKLIEKFKRVSPTQIIYSFEVNDPKVFTAPTRAEIAFNSTKGPLFEYACHEGNSYSFAAMLAGQRAADAENEKMMADARKKRKK